MMTYDDWRASNPLAKFIAERDVKTDVMSALLCASPQLVRHWLIGGSRPNDTGFDGIARITGIARDELVAAWDTWLAQRATIDVDDALRF